VERRTEGSNCLAVRQSEIYAQDSDGAFSYNFSRMINDYHNFNDYP
jgi:hypothetical protein